MCSKFKFNALYSRENNHRPRITDEREISNNRREHSDRRRHNDIDKDYHEKRPTITDERDNIPNTNNRDYDRDGGRFTQSQRRTSPKRFDRNDETNDDAKRRHSNTDDSKTRNLREVINRSKQSSENSRNNDIAEVQLQCVY